MARYLINILIGLDQLLTALLGGWPDETISSYAYRLENKGRLFGRWFRPLIDAIFFWQKDHCRRSWQAEAQRRQFPPSLRL